MLLIKCQCIADRLAVCRGRCDCGFDAICYCGYYRLVVLLENSGCKAVAYLAVKCFSLVCNWDLQGVLALFGCACF